MLAMLSGYPPGRGQPLRPDGDVTPDNRDKPLSADGNVHAGPWQAAGLVCRVDMGRDGRGWREEPIRYRSSLAEGERRPGAHRRERRESCLLDGVRLTLQWCLSFGPAPSGQWSWPFSRLDATRVLRFVWTQLRRFLWQVSVIECL